MRYGSGNLALSKTVVSVAPGQGGKSGPITGTAVTLDAGLEAILGCQAAIAGGRRRILLRGSEGSHVRDFVALFGSPVTLFCKAIALVGCRKDGLDGILPTGEH